MRIAKIGVNKDGFKVASQRTCPPVSIKECLPFEVLFGNWSMMVAYSTARSILSGLSFEFVNRHLRQFSNTTSELMCSKEPLTDY